MSEHPTTDNHDWPRITPGTLADQWGAIYNSDLIDPLDKKTPLVGLDANKSNFTPYSGAIYVATDTNIIYTGTGSTWDELSLATSGNYPETDSDETITATWTHYSPILRTVNGEAATVDMAGGAYSQLTFVNNDDTNGWSYGAYDGGNGYIWDHTSGSSGEVLEFIPGGGINAPRGVSDDGSPVVANGDSTKRDIWVSDDGTTPAGASADDIVLTPA